MSYYYKTENGVVQSVIVADADVIDAGVLGTGWVQAPGDTHPVIGYAPTADGFTPPIPTAVTMRQARLALLAAGLLPSVDTTIAALPEPQKSAAKIEWEYSQEVQRHNGFVSVLAPALGLSDEQIDALFVAAGAL
jgi:hypothetical protein